MTPGFLPGSRRFAGALFAALVTLAVADTVRAEEAAPATTTNADVAQPKPPTTTKKKVTLPAKPAADAAKAATNADAAKAAAAKSTTNADVAKPAPAAVLKKPESAQGATNADATKPAAAAEEKKTGPAKAAGAAKPTATATGTDAAKPATATNADAAKPAATNANPAKPATTATNADAAKPAATKPAAGAAAAAGAASGAPAAAAPATPPASSPEAEAVWKAYEKRWSETEDYSAGFRQTIEVPDVGSRVESAGRFYFAKPGLVRWDYTEGPPQTVVGDGTWIWLYQPDLEQVYKIPYAKAFGRGGLVELLAGREGVSGRYATTLERPDPKTVRILLKSLTEASGNLEVTLEADTFDIREVTVHDAAGSTTHMIFAEPRRNHGADKTRFTFTPPKGVDIISDSEAGF